MAAGGVAQRGVDSFRLTVALVTSLSYTGVMSRTVAGILIKPTRNRKPTAPRTCCPTHTDTCKFGREHRWSMGWIGGPKSGLGVGEPGWHDSTICSECKGICTADLEDGQVA